MIKQILQERDGMTAVEAVARLNDTRERIYDAIASGNFEEAEDIMYGDLGLEMDYILELI